MGKRPPGPGQGNRVKQGSGMPAGGEGWGGEANAGKASGKARLKPGAHTAAAIEAKESRAAEMRDVLHAIALRGEAEANRLNAAFKLHTLLEPMPKQEIEATGSGLVINVVKRADKSAP